MATHKSDLTVLNVTQLAALVRCKPHTMRRKLDGLDPVQTDGRERLYDAADALAKYFIGESLDLSRERARLAKEQADAQAMRNSEERNELVRGEDVEAFIIPICSGLAQHLRSLPAKAAPEAHGAKSIAECKAVLDIFIVEALADLVHEISGSDADDRPPGCSTSRADGPRRSRVRLEAGWRGVTMADVDPLEELEQLIAEAPPWAQRLAAKLADVMRPTPDSGDTHRTVH